MKWNGFGLINESIDKTKELIFPFSIRRWLKIGFLGFMSNYAIGTSNPNLNYGSSQDQRIQATGDAIKNVGITAITAAVIGAIVSIALIVVFIFSYLRSTITFVFLNALEKKDLALRTNYKKYKSIGVSFFGFKMLFSTIALIIMLIIFSPLIYIIVKEWKILITGSAQFWNLNNIILIAAVIIVFIIYMILLSVVWCFIMNFVIPNMYYKNIKFTPSLFESLKKLNQQKTEFIVFIFSRIAIGIIVGLILLLTMLIALIPFIIIGAILFFISLFIPSFIIFAIIIAIPLVILLFLISLIVQAPFVTFMTYHSILSYKEFIKVGKTLILN